MQELIDKWNTEVVPLLIKKYPKRFTNYFSNVLYPILDMKRNMTIDPKSLDDLAIVSEVCGIVTAATYATVSAPCKWLAMYVDTLGVKKVLDEWYDSEPVARLSVTIHAILQGK